MKTVPCNGCTLCCYHPSPRPLTQEEIESGAYRQRDGLLDLTPEGACIYATPKGCSIYERRPLLCQEFDCRDFAKFTYTIARKANIIVIWNRGRDLLRQEGPPATGTCSER